MAALDAEIARIGPGRGTQGFQFRQRFLVAGGARQRAHLRVAVHVVAVAHHLGGPEIGAELFGGGLGHVHAEHRAPGTAHQDQLAFSQPLAYVRRHGQGVVAQLLDGEPVAVGRLVAAVGHARAALVPVHDGVVLFPVEIGALVVDAQGVARTAMRDQDDRIGAAGAAHRHPLLDAADANEALFVHGLLRPGAGGRRRRRQGGQRRGQQGGGERQAQAFHQGSDHCRSSNSARVQAGRQSLIRMA